MKTTNAVDDETGWAPRIGLEEGLRRLVIALKTRI
jgi:nucleoside-diphosphate-sugar epimerase